MDGWRALNPWPAIFARHAQHVVLIHFPIALFVTGVALDWLGRWSRRRTIAHASYTNLLAAAWSTLPAFATGLLAWRLQLEGARLEGVLLLHLLLALASGVMIWIVWALHYRARRQREALPPYRWAVELLGVGFVMLTGHLGGVLSGVNGPG